MDHVLVEESQSTQDAKQEVNPFFFCWLWTHLSENIRPEGLDKAIKGFSDLQIYLWGKPSQSLVVVVYEHVRFGIDQFGKHVKKKVTYVDVH